MPCKKPEFSKPMWGGHPCPPPLKLILIVIWFLIVNSMSLVSSHLEPDSEI